MDIPQEFHNTHEGTSYVLRIKRSIYGLKQSNYNFYNKLDATLKERSILPCSTDKYVHASKDLMLIVCVDDMLIFSKKEMLINLFIKSLSDGVENFELKDGGNMGKHRCRDTQLSKWNV